MANKLYDSNGTFIGQILCIERRADEPIKVILDTGHALHFSPENLIMDSFGNYHILKNGDRIDSMRYAKWAKALLSNPYEKKENNNMTAASIKNVIFNPPATIVYWTDGSKTVVKCSANDIFDPEKGLAMAIAKRACGNNNSYYKEIRHWVEKSKINYPGASTPSNAPANKDILKKYVQNASNDLNEFLSAAMNGNNAELLFKIGALTADLAILEQELNK